MFWVATYPTIGWARPLPFGIEFFKINASTFLVWRITKRTHIGRRWSCLWFIWSEFPTVRCSRIIQALFLTFGESFSFSDEKVLENDSTCWEETKHEKDPLWLQRTLHEWLSDYWFNQNHQPQNLSADSKCYITTSFSHIHLPNRLTCILVNEHEDACCD